MINSFDRDGFVQVLCSFIEAKLGELYFNWRKTITTDGSILLHCEKFCVDIYESGEIVILIKDGANTIIYDLKHEDLDQALEILDGIRNIK
jgi:hypothetical protein